MRASTLLAILLVGGSAAAQPEEADVGVREDSWQAGRALFIGERALQGRIATHPTALPPAVVRCANCHAPSRGPAVSRTLAPRLTREFLTLPQSRRGGPRTTYDAASLCTLLRSGEDPAHILVNPQMPRYMLQERDCFALWRFLGGEEENHAP